MSCVGSSLVALTAAAGVARRSCKHIHHPGVASWASFAATQRHTSDSKSRKELQRHAGTLTRPEASKDQRGSLASQLAKAHRLPLFTVPSEQLKLIEHPKDFYGELLSMISRAKRRIFLASLYIGKSENELMDHLSRALASQPGLEVTVLVDRLRSTREGHYAGDRASESCASLLAGLQRTYPDRVHVRLYRAPGLPQWLEKLVGKRYIEGWGLQHMKIYGVDDEVMISGANLSNDYFTNRRDRYVTIKSGQISAYMYGLLMIAARYSFALRARRGAVDRNASTSSTDTSRHSAFDVEWDDGKDLPVRIDSEKVDNQHWRQQMRLSVEDLTQRFARESDSSPSQSDETVDVVPLLQLGPLTIRHETDVVPKVLDAASQQHDSRLVFTTGYFSINPLYASKVLHGSFRCNMITASPQANGFYGSKGVSKYLPAGYTWLTQRFWRRLVSQGRAKDVTISEWGKPGWTYHAKGIWLYSSGEEDPCLSLLGSSNFGTRSAKLDLECTLLLDAGRSPDIQQRLGAEVRELARDARDTVDAEMFARPDRVVPWGVKVAARLLQRML